LTFCLVEASVYNCARHGGYRGIVSIPALKKLTNKSPDRAFVMGLNGCMWREGWVF
jgi:hypothetical protein